MVAQTGLSLARSRMREKGVVGVLASEADLEIHSRAKSMTARTQCVIGLPTVFFILSSSTLPCATKQVEYMEGVLTLCGGGVSNKKGGGSGGQAPPA